MNDLIIELVGGPGDGHQHDRCRPEIGTVAGCLYYDKASKRTHRYSATYQGGGSLKLKHRGVAPEVNQLTALMTTDQN